MAVAAAIDLLYGREASLIAPLVFGPFIASALAPVRDTVVVATTATVLAVVLGWADGTIGTSPHLVRTVSVALGGGLAIWLATERTRREAKLRAVSDVAEAAQRAILHPLPAELGSVRLAGRYLSAAEEAQVGGDFYDAVETSWGVRLVVGDVRGKGLGAVRLASALLGEFRSRAVCEPDLGELATLVDAAGCRLPGETSEDFATAVFVQLQGDSATIVRSGHPFPLLARGRDVSQIRTTGSLPLCLGTEGIPEDVHLPPGARVLCYSDGAFEGRNRHGVEFDLGASFARHAAEADLAVVLDAILADLTGHCGGAIGDDVVLVIAELAPGPGREGCEPS